jgi:hypothetical protein
MIINTNTDTDYRICIVDGLHGIYVPQRFAQLYSAQVSASLLKELHAGPDSETYWEAWEEVLNTSKIIIDGTIYSLEQDQDVFAIPIGEVAF